MNEDTTALQASHGQSGWGQERPPASSQHPGRLPLALAAGAHAPPRGSRRAASGHAQWRQRPLVAQSEACGGGGGAGGADARAAAKGTGGRREGAGAREVGPPSPSRPLGARGAAAAAHPLGSVSGAAPGPAAELREQGAALCPELGRGAPAPLRRHGPPHRATAATSRRNPRASSRPRLSDPRFSAPPPSALFTPLLSLPLTASALRMATEPPSPLRLEAPGPPEMRTPAASEAAPEGTPKPAGGRLRFLNGCVPLSHQVAGHMYGKDKVGKWGWRGVRCSPSAFERPRPTEAAWCSPAGEAPLRALMPHPRSLPLSTKSLATSACTRGWKSGDISWVWGVRPAAGGGEKRSV